MLRRAFFACVLLLLTLLLLSANQPAAAQDKPGGEPLDPKAQTFNVFSNRTGVRDAVTRWADYDGDGGLDLLILGRANDQPFASILHRAPLGWTDIHAPIPGLILPIAAWGDYDGDGDLDLYVGGCTVANGCSDVSSRIGRLYRNDAGTFVVAADLRPMMTGDAEWADFDRDGDLDLLVSGVDGASIAVYIYRNDHGTLVETHPALGDIGGAVTVGDYDADGDPDVAISGFDSRHDIAAAIFRNNGSGVFTNIGAPLTPLFLADNAWGDFDGDGDLDLAQTGCALSCTSTQAHTEIYRNNGGAFANINATLPALSRSALDWGDFDNDGDLDLLVSGQQGGFGTDNPLTAIFRNDNGSFVNSGFSFTNVFDGMLDWGDIDGDLDLDFVYAGGATSTDITQIRQNNGGPANTAPTAPGNLAVSVASDGKSALLSWKAGSDAQTPAAALTYNLRVGTSPGANDVLPALSLSDGQRMVPGGGNVGSRRSFTIRGLTPGTRYYWSVQTVDSAYAGSPFAAAATFETPLFRTALSVTDLLADAAAWGDIDGDGDLDLLLAGCVLDTCNSKATRVYINNNGSFTAVLRFIVGVSGGSMALGDYDGDGDLDLLIAGTDSNGARVASIYRNNGSGSFTDINAGLPGVANSSVAWADADHDGDLDAIISGQVANGALTRIYRNNGGVFGNSILLAGRQNGAVAAADFNRDGRNDLAFSGFDGSGVPVTTVISDLPSGAAQQLTGLGASSLDWADFDGDGDLDLLAAGCADSACRKPVSKLFRTNSAGTLLDAHVALVAAAPADVAWADYDGDGDPDALISGASGATVRSTLYRNDRGTLRDTGTTVPAVSGGVLAWGDYDNDHAPDLLLAGSTGSSYTVRVLHNNIVPGNKPPRPPGGLTVTPGDNAGDGVLGWGTGDDGETISVSLSYNLRVGTSPGASDVLAPNAAANGFRRIPALGNASTARQRLIGGLNPDRVYYASVQTVDSTLQGSVFSPEISFTLHVLTTTQTGLPGLEGGSARWGDFDGDGDLDVLVTGNAGAQSVSQIWRNNRPGFSLVASAVLPGVKAGDGEWGDFDGDGDLDIVLVGDSGTTQSGAVPFAAIFRNNGGGNFSQALAASDQVGGGSGLLPVIKGAAAWGDYDGDGDLDLVISGVAAGGTPVTRLLNNVGGLFHQEGPAFPGAVFPALAWADYDRDGDLDLAITGCTTTQCTAGVSSIQRNNGNGTFTALSGLPAFHDSYLDWADFDGDGDLDLLIGGVQDDGVRATRVLRNNNGAFVDSGITGLAAAADGDAAWGDFDADGDPDLLISGFINGGSAATELYRNSGGTLVDLHQHLPGMTNGTVEWGDFDLDGRLDALLAAGTRLLHNISPRANTPPTLVGPPQISFARGVTTLRWSAGSDTQTISPTLTYNVLLKQGTTQTVPAMALDPGGTRLLPAPGNAGPTTTLKIKNLAPGLQYVGAVQAIDNSFAGSTFNGHVSFVVPHLINTPTTLPDVLDGAAIWGDIDGDGDLDVALAGNNGSARISKIFRNNGSGVFSDTGFALPGVDLAALAWGDFDNDGDLDLALSGRDSANARTTKLFRNNGAAGFADTGFALDGVQSGALAWGDFDNDGDLDLLVSGNGGPQNRLLRLYRNDRSAFVSVSVGPMPGVSNSAAAWGDYDNDGDMDLALSGLVGATPVGKVFRNDGSGVFSDSSIVLPGVQKGSLAWGDYDDDGDLDLLLTGLGAGGSVSKIFRNQGGSLNDSNAALLAINSGDADWIDFDSDGDLDVVLSGTTDNSGALQQQGKLYENVNGAFVERSAPNALNRGSVAWGDADGDRRPDVLQVGRVQSGAARTVLLLNNSLRASVVPVSVGGLATTINGAARSATLSWAPTNDDDQASVGLSYNLQVGTTSGGSQVMAPQTAGANGGRLLPAMGNTGQRTSWTITNLTPGQTYFWRVQAIDSSYLGGPFSTIISFTMPASSNNPNPGTNTPARGAALVDSPVQFVTTCSDPDGWRDIGTIDFRLYGSGVLSSTPLLWLQFDQNRNVFRAYDAGSGKWSEGSAGENRVLTTPHADLLLAGTHAQGRGPTNPTVDITWDVVFRDAASAYSQTVQINDDAGDSSGENPVGDWLVLPAGTQTFSDVGPSDYFFLPVEYLVAGRGAISGYDDNTFRPYNNTTRAQMVKIIARAAGWPLLNPATPTFGDVSPSNPFYREIETAVARGVVGGYGDGTFRPFNQVTRGQLAKIVVLAFAWPLLTPDAPSFADLPPDNAFYRYVETAAARGIVGGYTVSGGLEYRPGASAIRAQIAKIVYLALGQP